MLSLAAAASSCAGSVAASRTAPPLVVERPESDEAPIAIPPATEGALPMRAWRRPTGAMLAFDHVDQVSVHDAQICALTSAGAVWCVRTEGLVNRQTFVPEALARNTMHVALARPVREIAAGSTHACAIDVDGAAWCWGTNDQGELGNGTTTAQLEPVRVSGLEDVVQIAAGERFTCARTLDDAAYCWGHNATGQLGDGTRASRDRPVRVRGLPPVADIAAGRQHACARTHDGRAFCWGDNTHRQLGCSAYSDPSCTDPAHNERHPVRVPEVSRVSQLALGDAHSCARRFDDTVTCWGDRANSAGQVGYGREGWPDGWLATQLAAGPSASCAVMDATTVRCWGDFAFDAFDRGEEVRRSYELPGVRGAMGVSMGDRITCIRFGDTNARCWLR
jgi:alpha-tubulin suppressor-like RCC1 family protein